MRSDPTALKRIREAKGHTQRSLARSSTVSPQRISELEDTEREDGPVGVLPTTAKKLADVLGVAIADITQPDDVDTPVVPT